MLERARACWGGLGTPLARHRFALHLILPCRRVRGGPQHRRRLGSSPPGARPDKLATPHHHTHTETINHIQAHTVYGDGLLRCVPNKGARSGRQGDRTFAKAFLGQLVIPQTRMAGGRRVWVFTGDGGGSGGRVLVFTGDGGGATGVGCHW